MPSSWMYVRQRLSKVQNFIKEEEGQSTLEYILMVSFAVIVATSFLKAMLKILDQGSLKMGAQLEKDLKTGRAPLGVYKN